MIITITYKGVLHQEIIKGHSEELANFRLSLKLWNTHLQVVEPVEYKSKICYLFYKNMYN